MPWIQHSIQSPMVLILMSSDYLRGSRRGFTGPAVRTLVLVHGGFTSHVLCLIQSPMVLLFRTWVLVPAGFISPVIRASVLVFGVVASPVVNLGVSYRVFSSPVVRTSELVLESCTSHEFRNHFRPQWFYYSCSHNLRVLVLEGITSQIVSTCVLVPQGIHSLQVYVHYAKHLRISRGNQNRILKDRQYNGRKEKNDKSTNTTKKTKDEAT